MLISNAAGLLANVFRTAMFLALLGLGSAFSGCAGFDSDDEAGSPEPTPAMTPLSNDVVDEPQVPVVPIRATDDPDELLGTAVVLTSDGLLITTIDVLADDGEVLLPGGSALEPALVSFWPDPGLALLKVPVSDLQAVEMSSIRPAEGDEVVATGFDGAPGSLGRIVGEIRESLEPTDDADRRVRGASEYRVTAHLPDGFLGGAIFDDDDRFVGVITERSNDEDEVFITASHWSVMSWLEQREQRLERLKEESMTWEGQELLDTWSIRYPEGWSLSIPSESDDSMRAELAPADPDVSLQLAVSVEPNEYGTDTEEFIDEVFSGRSSARVWTVDELEGKPLVRASIVQEGALVDVAYVLEDERLIAVLLTSGYQVESDPAQVDEARALFDAVIQSLERN